MPKQRVLFVLGDFNIGGPSKSLIGLLDRIDNSRIEATVVALNPEGPLRGYIGGRARVMDVDAVQTAFLLPSTNTLAQMRVLIKRAPSLVLPAVRALSRHLLQRRPMNLERQIMWVKHSRRLPRFPGTFDVAIGFGSAFTTYFIVDCVDSLHKYHSVIADDRILAMNREIELRYFSQTDGALAVSHETAEIFTDLYPSMAECTRVLQNYIPVDYYASLSVEPRAVLPTAKDMTILATLTRLDPQKGLELVVTACEVLTSRGIPVKWVVMGDGPERASFQRAIADAGLEERFVLPGFVNNPFAILARSDILVHPSHTEGKSIAIDEAKFLGLPVVATRFDTVESQVTDGVNGLIADFTAIDIADKIQRLITDRSLAGEISAHNLGVADSDENGDLTEYLLGLSIRE